MTKDPELSSIPVPVIFLIPLLITYFTIDPESTTCPDHTSDIFPTCAASIRTSLFKCMFDGAAGGMVSLINRPVELSVHVFQRESIGSIRQ